MLFASHSTLFSPIQYAVSPRQSIGQHLFSPPKWSVDEHLSFDEMCASSRSGRLDVWVRAGPQTWTSETTDWEKTRNYPGYLSSLAKSSPSKRLSGRLHPRFRRCFKPPVRSLNLSRYAYVQSQGALAIFSFLIVCEIELVYTIWFCFVHKKN
jgi:hypothetical protein